ncbi:hypothetical protein A9Q96_12325 [Rhodobacterales bacterium 52_120_T64]|nr:hypothetical protein A9Q96_12325 [Rhodobacterales bacterium 52_120_T64]
MIYSFQEFELDTNHLELRRSGKPQKIEPQVFSLLELLVSKHHRIVSKDEINQQVWGGRVVSEATVNSRIRSARLAIGDNGKSQKLIKTTHNHGFRFVGDPVSTGNIIIQDYLAEALEQSDQHVAKNLHGKPSIAVLPLQLLSNDLHYQIFADAISHELIVELSRLHWFHIIARGSSFRFRNADADVTAIGKLLGVQYVLSGNLRIADKMGICTVELSNSSDGQVIWADEFEGPIEDFLILRSRIIPRIVAIIETQIQSNEILEAKGKSTENLDAWAAYHRGLWHMFRFNRHDNEISAQLFELAIRQDSQFSRAHSGLSFTHFQNAFIGFTKDHSRQRNLARAHAETAFDIDPFDPFANLTMGRAEMLSGDFEASIPWFDRCLELRPSYAFAIYNRGLVDAVLGNGLDSQRRSMKALSLSPLDPLLYAMLCCRGLSHLVRGEYDSASDWSERGAVRPNSHMQIWAIAAMSHELAGNQIKAQKWVDRINETDPKFGHCQFFQSFPIRDSNTRSIARDSLVRLGF